MNANQIVNKLVEDDELDSPKVNLDRYLTALGTQQDENEHQMLDRFKRGVKAYIKWANTDEDMGATYDPADLRRVSRAKNFEQVLAILRKYETEPTFLSMVAQGYFT